MGERGEIIQTRAGVYAKFADFRPTEDRHFYMADPYHNALYRLAELVWENRKELSQLDSLEKGKKREEIVKEALAYIDRPEDQPELSHSWPGAVGIIIKELIDVATIKSEYKRADEVAEARCDTRLGTLMRIGGTGDIVQTLGVGKRH